jgi:hypothetical protein
LKVDTDLGSETDFEVYADENNGILVKKNGTVIFSVNPESGKVYLYGDADILNGIFRGSIASGPLTLNKSPPVNSSFTISGSIAQFLIDLYNSTGLSGGTFACSGAYGASTLGKVQITITKTAKTYKYTQVKSQNYKNWWNCDFWERDTFYYSVSITLYDVNQAAVFSNTDTYETASTWHVVSSAVADIGLFGPTTPAPSPLNVAASGGTVNFGSAGTLSFTAAAYTFKLESLPIGYSAGYAAGTAYLDENGFLKIKT